MKTFARLLLSFSAAAAASFAACPAGTNASQIIQSSAWAFNLKSGSTSTVRTESGSAVVGFFKPLSPGTLQVVVSSSNAGATVRRQEAIARYILYPNCTGGELLFYVNGLGFQVEFAFADNFQEMFFVTDDWNARYGGTSSLTGTARKATSACPAGLGNPLNILNGTNWSFRTYSAYYAFGPGSASVGVFSPVITSGAGRLTGTETINYGSFGPIVSHAQLSGRYIIYPDCSGGEIMLMNRGNPVPYLQMEFVFAGPDFGEMFMLNDSISNSQSVVAGYASKN